MIFSLSCRISFQIKTYFKSLHILHFFLLVKRNPLMSEEFRWLHIQSSNRRMRYIGISLNHRITKWLNVTLAEVWRNLWRSLHLPPSLSRVTSSMLLRITSNQLLNISKVGDFCYPCQCSVTLKVKKFRTCHVKRVTRQFPGFGITFFSLKVLSSWDIMVSMYVETSDGLFIGILEEMK